MRWTRRTEKIVFAILLMYAMAIAFSSCSEQRKAFKRHGVERHQPKFEPSR